MKFKKIVSKTLSVLLVVVFVFALFVFLSVIRTPKGAVPELFGYSVLRVSTASMEPLYPVGSIVIAKKIDPADLKDGDIISYYSAEPAIYGLPNTHRILSTQSDETDRLYFVTKGDNNPVADYYPVYTEDLIGKVSFSIGSVGSVLGFLQNRVVLFFLLIVPLVGIVVFEMRHFAQVMAARKTEKEDTAANDDNDDNNTADKA